MELQENLLFDDNLSCFKNPYFEMMATEIIDYVKSFGIHVLRYDSKSSDSIYLKFDYGLAGSLKISDHNNTNGLKDVFNIIQNLENPYSEKVNLNNGSMDTYYYPDCLYKNVAKDIVRYKDYRVAKYGLSGYSDYSIKNKEKIKKSRTFWSKAIEV